MRSAARVGAADDGEKRPPRRRGGYGGGGGGATQALLVRSHALLQRLADPQDVGGPGGARYGGEGNDECK